MKHLKAPLQIKSLEENGTFEGYASVFGVMDSDGDVIMKGAFKKSIERMVGEGRKPKMLWQHNYTQIIGKWQEMYEDEKGLYVKGQLLLDLEKARECYTLMQNGCLDAMSVGFNIENATNGNGYGKVITDADLWEISVVTWGANPEALVTNVKSIKDFEKFLRDAGYSRKQATALASGGYKAAFSQGDPDSELLTAIKTLKATIEELNNG